jgi:hypothetical protein
MIAGTPCDRRRHCALRDRSLKQAPLSQRVILWSLADSLAVRHTSWTGTLREQKKKDILQAPNARYGKCKKIFSQRVGAPEKGVLVSSP